MIKTIQLFITIARKFNIIVKKCIELSLEA